jgi:gas vesicle protein
MAEQQAHHNTMLVPVLAGLAGAGLALLFAPRSGKETRTMMHDNAQETMDTARSKANAGLTQAKELKERLQNAVQPLSRKTGQDDSNQSETITSWEQEV